MRTLALSAAALMFNIALNLSISRWGDFLPDSVVVCLWILPILPLGYWVWTHQKNIRTRQWLGEQFEKTPKTTVTVLALCIVIAIFSLTSLGIGVWKHIPRKTYIPAQVASTPSTTTKATSNKSETRSESIPTPHLPTSPLKKPSTAPPSVQINSAPNGIGIGGGVVTNPTVNNFQPPQRTIPENEKSQIVQILSTTPGKIEIQFPSNDQEAYSFAQEWSGLLKQANWSVDRVVGVMRLGSGPQNIVSLSYRGQPVSGEKITVPMDSLVGHLGQALQLAGVEHVQGEPSPNMAEDAIVMYIGAHP